MSADELSSTELSELQVWEQWPKTYPAGRVCDHEGCATILSRYNATMYCGAHPPDTGLRFHGMTFKQCACGAITGRDSKSGTCRKCADAERGRDQEFTDTLLLGSKYCPTCRLPKPRSSDYFGRDIHQDDGLRHECKACSCERARERYANDPEFREKRKAYSKAYSRKAAA